MKTIATLMIAVAFMAVPTAASATRVVPGGEDRDLCRNVEGVQTVYDVTGFGAEWTLDFSTPRRRHDCVRADARPM